MQEKIKNSELLTEAFGKVPSFHDAEVVQINLARRFGDEMRPALEASIKVANYHHSAYFLVKLSFRSIFGLRLENFNHQNVLGGLIVEDFSEEFFDSLKSDDRLRGVVGPGEIERLEYYVKFEYCFGIEAEFLCGEIVAESIEPFISG